MPRLLFALPVFLMAFNLNAGVSIPVKDNADVALTLSQGNYNRLVVKNDKIIEAVFPPNALGIKRDEQDGSIYLMLTTVTPFTLFLTTESGRHFSTTISGEESLGKTIELIPHVTLAKANINHNSNSGALAKNFTAKKEEINDTNLPQAITSLISHMEQGKKLPDVKVKYLYGQAERLKIGLVIIPKEIWQGPVLKAEVLEIYNSSNTPINLSASWFANDNIKAVKLSQNTITPKGRIKLYRVQEEAHA